MMKKVPDNGLYSDMGAILIFSSDGENIVKLWYPDRLWNAKSNFPLSCLSIATETLIHFFTTGLAGSFI